MKTGSTLLNAELPDEVATYARLWTIAPKVGDPIRFTDCDQTVTFEGNTYSNEIGFNASSIVSAKNSISQGADILTTITTDISEERIRSGYFDDAVCHLVIADYDHPEKGGIKLFGGTIGKIEYDDLGKVTITVAGRFSNSTFLNVENYSKLCRAELGDARCTFDIFSLVGTFTIDTVSSTQKFVTLELNQINNYWQYGVLQFDSGNNSGVILTVGGSNGNDKSITLFIPAPFVLEPGDTGTIYPGCDKTLLMCRSRYNNLINFRGEPFNPKIQGNL